MTTKRGFLLALAASATIGTICPAFGEVYPARPITIVVPFPAGGSMDTVGRILAEPMRASLGSSDFRLFPWLQRHATCSLRNFAALLSTGTYSHVDHLTVRQSRLWEPEAGGNTCTAFARHHS